jgi:polyhydroxyalkanoate synthase
MTDFRQQVLDRGLELNQRVAEAAGNGLAWLFKRDTLIKSGRTWFELVHDSDLMSVRYYELPEEDQIELVDGSTMPIKRDRYAVPLVLVPPLGVTTETFDLMPQRSLVRYMAAAGFKTYLIDWGKPRREHSRLGLEDYSYTMMQVALQQVRRHAGVQTLSTMGWCLGGLLCIMYQSQARDPDLRNIVTVASPIDPSTGHGVLGRMAGVAQALNAPAKMVSNVTNLRLNSLDPERLGLPGWMTALAFKLTDPVSSVTTYWDLVTRLWDREFVESYSTTSDYLNNMLHYPGGVLKDIMTQIIGENALVTGQLRLGDRTCDLANVTSNLLAFAGATDHIVAPEVAAGSIELVGSEDKEFRVAPGGHMGVIVGSKAQRAVWKESAEWLAPRSEASAADTASASRAGSGSSAGRGRRGGARRKTSAAAASKKAS